MIKFNSALYLGLEHSSDTLRPWKSLTTGAPAVLGAIAGSAALASDLAALTGLEGAVLAPSTLHLFWDLFDIWPKERVAIHVDERAYAVGRWGAERMASRGVPVGVFAHHDAVSLGTAVRRARGRSSRPIVLTNGFCPECGRMAPLPEYLALLRRHGGWLVVDDTQALGIFGVSPCPGSPYGKGGGGSLRWWGAEAPEALLVCSMAKGFGVPMAFVAGSERMVRRYEANSETRVHSSPISAVQIAAGERAILFNRHRAEETRRRLSRLVKRFRNQLSKGGWETAGGEFPVQSFAIPSEKETLTLYSGLLRLGVEPVLQAAGHNGQGRIAFLITANHSAEDVDQAAESWLRVVSTGAAVRRGRTV